MANKKLDVRNPIFHDDDKAREHLEALLWPDGPYCPHCGMIGDRITKLQGTSTRPGLYKCKDCRKPFSVTIGTVMERSHVRFSKWVLAAQLMASSKKGFSALQLQRMIGTNYETAWFMFHRLRECANNLASGPLGGQGKIVKANERDGKVRSRHVADVTAKTLRKAIVTQADRKSYLMTDEAPVYVKTGQEFSGHGTVNHSADEYVRHGGFMRTNTIESFFAIMKRGVYGNFHSVSEAHLHRYLSEFDFKYNHRSALGYDDAERADALLRGAKGKRLLYQWPDEAAHA